jgi:hypothetical protein
LRGVIREHRLHNPGRRGRVARTLGQRRGLVACICKGLHPEAAAEAGVNAAD